jgi:hypothetical protein
VAVSEATKVFLHQVGVRSGATGQHHRAPVDGGRLCARTGRPEVGPGGRLQAQEEGRKREEDEDRVPPMAPLQRGKAHPHKECLHALVQQGQHRLPLIRDTVGELPGPKTEARGYTSMDVMGTWKVARIR